jgi:hypothetical protein
MRKIAIIGLFLTGILSCEQEKVITDLPQQEGKVMHRSIPQDDLPAVPNGPNSVSRGTTHSQSQEAGNARALQLAFIPNAGAIWTDPSTGKTHLLAMQLPGIPGSRQVAWQSLGTGWEGSEFMTMDRENFYVVWGEEVYRVPKSTPDTWTLIIPNNGEDIKGIVGHQTNSTIAIGGHLARGGNLYTFNAAGVLTLQLQNPGVVSNTTHMAGYRYTSNGAKAMFFKMNTSGALWNFTNHPEGIVHWDKLSSAPQTTLINMVGNPMTELVYKSKKLGGSRIDTINPANDGAEGNFSILSFTPVTAPLVVNNGYLWIMGNQLHQLMTLGSQKGKPAYSEGGWNGVLLGCADATLVFN